MAPTPVSLTRKSHGQRSLAGYNPQGHKESDTTERLSTRISENDLSYPGRTKLRELGGLTREAVYIRPGGFSNLRKPRLAVYRGAHSAVLIIVPLDCTDIHAFSR